MPSLNRTDKRLESNIFNLSIFSDCRISDDDIQIVGLENMKRTKKYVNRKFIDMSHENINRYKIILPTANGSGAIGEVLSTPLIGYTRTFIGIGSFKALKEAQNALKYIKSKFARTMLGILKITQHNNPEKWKLVPLQDFSDTSDIDWSKSIHEIDLQLYRKYKLDEQEIDFIETHVKEMA